MWIEKVILGIIIYFVGVFFLCAFMAGATRRSKEEQEMEEYYDAMKKLGETEENNEGDNPTEND